VSYRREKESTTTVIMVWYSPNNRHLDESTLVEERITDVVEVAGAEWQAVLYSSATRECGDVPAPIHSCLPLHSSTTMTRPNRLDSSATTTSSAEVLDHGRPSSTKQLDGLKEDHVVGDEISNTVFCGCFAGGPVRVVILGLSEIQ
jgi:hypothetical protein